MARFGFTTGSCAAAASKAAAYMLLTGKIKNEISIITPKGVVFNAKIVDIVRGENCVSCSVIKDGGDDPDVTTGAHICASVSYCVEGIDDKLHPQLDASVYIDGGDGVGRITKPGLDQPIGNAAINSVPRQMITDEVSEVMKLCDYKGNLSVIISIPEGKALADRTFNPRLGIVDGISILGTSGIVEPMSSKALIDTIEVELNQKAALGFSIVPISPGNYGLEYMKRTYDFDLDVSVKCSNFIGDTVDMVVSKGFDGMLLTGHIGKLVKVAGGMMNTHSKYGDNRMQVISQAAKKHGASDDIISRILDSVATEDAVDILDTVGIRDRVMDEIMSMIMYNLRNRAHDKVHIECMMYSNKHGMLAASEGALCMLSKIQNIIR